jgi:SAM-dependent methyltransferase
MQMPVLERKAMSLCRGSVLDVGACAGAHSVYLQGQGFDVTALESSPLCCEVLISRQIKQVICEDIYQFEGRQYDTILLLMNGTGIGGTLNGLERLLRHLQTLLKPEGQILIDSSDLIYLYQEEDGSALIDVAADHYYGELTFKTQYKKWESKSFPWLYVDLNNLQYIAKKNFLKVSKTFYGQHYDYLARLTSKIEKA